MKKFDKDGDGNVTICEFVQAGGMKAIFGDLAKDINSISKA